MNASDVLQIYVDVESYEESLQALLRRMNKLLESNAVVDLQQRQRVTIDAIRSSATATSDLAGSIPVVATGNVNAAVSNGVGGAIVSNNASNPYVTASTTTALIMEGPVHQVWRIANDAQACYASAIRSKLTFS